jgi:tetratricopeptide (TPR) repeat protein
MKTPILVKHSLMCIFWMMSLFYSSQSFTMTDFQRAEQLYQIRKFDEAERLFVAYLQKNPSHTETIRYLGLIAAEQKDWKKASDWYQKIVKIEPKNAEFRYLYGGFLGNYARTVNRFKALSLVGDVERSFLEAVRLDAKHIDARIALVMLYMELPMMIGGGEMKAKKYADELMRLSTSKGLYAEGLIEEYNKNYRKALLKFTQSFSAEKDAECYQKIIDLYRNKLKEPALALEFQRKHEGSFK